MKKDNTFQLELDGARFYEKYFVPTLFEQWAKVMIDRLNFREGERLLDVACGTGIVARSALQKSPDSTNNIVGCDLNNGMLKVALEIAPDIKWIEGPAENLPFKNQSFDKVCCQFGIMFFQDKTAALNELLRIKTTNGKAILSIWNRIEDNDGYYDLWKLVEEIGGSECASILHSPFSLGNREKILESINSSRTNKYQIETVNQKVNFPSIDYWIDCDIKASPIASKLSSKQYQDLVSRARTSLNQYVLSDGKVEFEMSAHFVNIE